MRFEGPAHVDGVSVLFRAARVQISMYILVSNYGSAGHIMTAVLQIKQLSSSSETHHSSSHTGSMAQDGASQRQRQEGGRCRNISVYNANALY